MERHNNANDWRSQLDPKVRTEVLWIIAEWLKTYCLEDDEGSINNAASKFEEKIYTEANDEKDYIRKIIHKMHELDIKLQLRSINRTNTQDSVMDQAQSLPTALSCTQTPASQPWLLLQNTQTNLNISRSLGLTNQVPTMVSVAQNVNSHVGKGVQISSLPGSQRQSQVMGQQLPQHQRVHSSHQQQMVVLSEDPKKKQRENLINQLMNVLTRQQNPLLLGQNNREQQGAFKVSSSQQTNFEATAQHNSSNLQHMYQLPQCLNTASASTLQQQKDKSGGQSGNSNVHRSSLLGTQSQKVEQSEPMVSQQYLVQKQHQNRSLPKHLDSVMNDTQRFQAASSLRENQKLAQLQNPLHQLQRAPLANPSTVQDSTVGDWKEETYQKIKALKEMHLHFMSAVLQKVEQKLMQNVSPESIQSGETQKLNKLKVMLKNIIDYLNVKRSYMSEKHRDFFSLIEKDILRITTMFRSPMQREQRQIQYQQTHQTSPQGHVLQSLKKDQINSGLMTSNQIGSLSSVSGLNSTSQIMKTHSMQTRPKSEPRDENNIMASSRNVVVPSPGSNLQALPSPGSNLQAVHSLNSIQSSMIQQQFHYGQMQKSPEVNQQVQVLTSHQTNEMNNVETRLLQQPLLLSQNQLLLSKHQLPNSLSNDSPLASSPKIQDYSSPKFMDQQTTVNQTITTCGSPIVDLSSILGDIENFIESPDDLPLASSPSIQDYSSPQFMDQQTTVNQTITTCGSPIVDLSLLGDIENFIECPDDLPLASSPSIQDYSSSQFMDQQTTVNQTITTGDSSKVDLSSILGDIDNFIESPLSNAQSSNSSVKLDTPEQTPFTDPPEAIIERPIYRLINAVQQGSQTSLAESASQMSSVITMADRIAGSFHPYGRSQAGLGEDLSETTKLRWQKRNLMTDGETNQTKRLKRSISTLPRDITSQSDSFNHFSSLQSEFDSITSSWSNVNKIESGHVLLQEIREINGRFVETVVEICSEDSSGTIVKCSYTPVALTGTLKDHYYNSGKISQIQPLRVQVPANYPSCSPIFLEEFPPESSVLKHEDLWSRTKLKFSISMKELPEPVSLKQIAQTWNDSARATILEYAERYGGGTFSSKYGVWRNIV